MLNSDNEHGTDTIGKTFEIRHVVIYIYIKMLEKIKVYINILK